MANSNPLKIALAIYHLPLLVQVNFPKSYYEPSIMSTSYTLIPSALYAVYVCTFQ